MTDGPSDVLVFFGATGDLAYKKTIETLAEQKPTCTWELPPITATLQSKFGFEPERVAAAAREQLRKP